MAPTPDHSHTSRDLSPLTAEETNRIENAQILQEGIAAFERLAADPVAWANYQEERKIWEATLMDGLRSEPTYEDEHTPEGQKP